MWLDGAVPDWRQHVNHARLDLGSGVNCVLGQLDGWIETPPDRAGDQPYDVMLRWVRERLHLSEARLNVWVVAHGFEVPDPTWPDGMTYDAWQQEYRRRLEMLTCAWLALLSEDAEEQG